MHNLYYQDQDCSLTLTQGIEEYRNYLVSIGRKVMEDEEGSSLITDHDATHVIFGLDTSLEQESLLDTWVVAGCSWKFSYILGYGKLDEIKKLYKALYNELGLLGFLKLYWYLLPRKWKVFRRTRRMKKKWLFNFPTSLLKLKISDIRSEYGINILSEEERSLSVTIDWSGVY